MIAPALAAAYLVIALAVYAGLRRWRTVHRDAWPASALWPATAAGATLIAAAVVMLAAGAWAVSLADTDQQEA